MDKLAQKALRNNARHVWRARRAVRPRFQAQRIVWRLGRRGR